MKNLWTYIVAAFTLLVGLFFAERSKRLTAETKVENNEAKLQDAILAEKQTTTDNNIALGNKRLQELQEEHDKSTQDDQADLSPEQIQEFWKRRNDS